MPIKFKKTLLIPNVFRKLLEIEELPDNLHKYHGTSTGRHNHNPHPFRDDERAVGVSDKESNLSVTLWLHSGDGNYWASWEVVPADIHEIHDDDNLAQSDEVDFDLPRKQIELELSDGRTIIIPIRYT